MADGQFDVGGYANGGFAGGGPPGGLPDFLKPENQADFAKAIEEGKKVRKAASAKIGELLTADQKAAFEKLTGAPFDFSSIDGGTTTTKPSDAIKKEDILKAMPKPKSRKETLQ